MGRAPIFFQAEVMSSSTFESPIDSLAGTIFIYSELDLHMPANRLPNCWLAGGQPAGQVRPLTPPILVVLLILYSCIIMMDFGRT